MQGDHPGPPPSPMSEVSLDGRFIQHIKSWVSIKSGMCILFTVPVVVSIMSMRRISSEYEAMPPFARIQVRVRVRIRARKRKGCLHASVMESVMQSAKPVWVYADGARGVGCMLYRQGHLNCCFRAECSTCFFIVLTSTSWT